MVTNNLEWQEIDKHRGWGNNLTFRAPIPGGWLVKTLWSANDGGGVGITFVPDPNNEWIINVEKQKPHTRGVGRRGRY